MKYTHAIFLIIRQKLHVRHRYIKVLLLLAAANLCLILTSCHPGTSDLLAYRQGPISAEISGRITPRIGGAIEFSATLKLGPPSECRSFVLKFHAPASLSGMKVSRNEDSILSVSRGDISITLSDDTVKNAIKIAEMLDSPGEILEISSISGSSVGLTEYDRLTSVRTQLCTLLIEPRSSLPIRASLSDSDCELIYMIIIS